MSDLTPTQLDELAVNNFRSYLQIPSVHPNIIYDECVTFLKKQANSINLPVKIFEFSPKKPTVLITWEGTQPQEPSILINGHMDVVPAFEEKWTHPPFSAHMDEEGNIYGRGSQDMKSASIQHLESIRRLKLNGVRLKRTIHISFSPDEEIGGASGMKTFVQSEDFKNLNVGFGLDEGQNSLNNKIPLYYGEKTWFQIWVSCPGSPGHGSVLYDNTAGEKLQRIIDKFMNFRESEKAKLKDPKVKDHEVISINLTMVKGGVQVNVVPTELSVAFDIRIPPGVDHQEFENKIKKWCEESGEGVHYTYINKDPPIQNTTLDSSNTFWLAFKQAIDHCGLELDPQIQTGVTDARFLRSIGIPALGFSPMMNTPSRAHDHNEYLNKEVFLKGIEIFMNIITAVANV